MAPVSWNGSVTIYHKVIKPFVLKHQRQVDDALDKAGEMAQDVLNEGEPSEKQDRGREVAWVVDVREY